MQRGSEGIEFRVQVAGLALSTVRDTSISKREERVGMDTDNG